jgi:hypothetical protein
MYVIKRVWYKLLVTNVRTYTGDKNTGSRKTHIFIGNLLRKGGFREKPFSFPLKPAGTFLERECCLLVLNSVTSFDIFFF